MPKEVLLVILDARQIDSLATEFEALSVAEKIIKIRNRIDAICKELKKTESKAMWIFTWREYLLVNDAEDAFIWQEQQKMFIREMSVLTKKYYPNLKLYTGPNRVRETLPSLSHLKRIQRQYRSIKWVQFSEEGPYRYLREHYLKWLKTDEAAKMISEFKKDEKDFKKRAWQCFFNQELNFEKWLTTFLKSEECEALKETSADEESFYLAAFGKFIRKNNLYVGEEFDHCHTNNYQIKMHQKHFSDVVKQVSMTEKAYFKYIIDRLDRTQWRQFVDNELDKTSWINKVPHDHHYYVDLFRLYARKQQGVLEEKKKFTSVDVIRNEGIILDGDGHFIFSKTAVFAELISSRALKSIFEKSEPIDTLFPGPEEKKISKPIYNPVVYEPATKANRNNLFKQKHSDGGHVLIGIEICRDHYVEALRGARPAVKFDIHLILAASIGLRKEHKYGKNLIYVDSVHPPVFLKSSTMSTDDVHVRVVVNKLFDESLSLIELPDSATPVSQATAEAKPAKRSCILRINA